MTKLIDAIARTPTFFERELPQLVKALPADCYPIQLVGKQYQPKRSLSANALYWPWMNTLAKHVSTPQATYTKDDLHDICRHQFLGYRSRGERMKDGSRIPEQLKSTTELTKPEFCFYLQLIDEWALSLGLQLPSPDESDYWDYKRAQVAA